MSPRTRTRARDVTVEIQAARAEQRESAGAQRDLALTQVTILDALPDHIALIDRTGVIVTVNQTWRSFGQANGLRSPDSGVGQNYLTLCDDATGDECEEAVAAAAGIRSVLDGSQPRFSLDYPCHFAQARRWFRLTATPMSEPHPGGAVLVHQEVTESKFAAFAAEEAADAQANLMATLAVERARLVEAQAVAKVGSWETDFRTMQTLWSEETFSIFGLEQARFHPTHNTFLDHCHPDDRARVDAAFQASVNTRALCSIEHRIVLADGSFKQVEERWHTYVDALGAPTRAVGTCQDITESHAVAAAVAEGQALLRDAATLSQVGAFRVQVNDGSRHWSEQACAIFEVPAGTTPTKEESLAFYVPASRARLLELHAACVRDGTPYDAELQIITRKGRSAWIRSIGRAVRDQTGAVVAINGAFQDISARRAATDALRQSEERFRQTFDLAPMGIIITAADGRFNEVNATFRRMVGYTTAELRERTFGELTHPDDRPASLAAMALLIGGKRESMTMDKRYLAADGRTVWARVSISAPRDDAGQPLYFITGVEDITREHEAQRALATSEERFRLLSKAANAGIYDWDIVTDVIWRNEGYQALFGHTITELGSTVGGWSELIHPDDRDRVLKAMHATLASASDTWSSEYRLRKADGSYAHVLDQGHIVRNQAGRAVRMIGSNADLTPRKESELKLTQQAALLDAAHDAILVRDMHDRITYWSKGAERTYGWLASEALGRTASELFRPDPAAYSKARALLLDRGQWEGELTKRGKDGKSRDMNVRWTLVRDEAGYPTSVLAITTDITERKRLEEQFLRAQRLESLGTLAGGIAHDLNNVLAPILVSIELLRMDDDDPERLESIATIEASAKRGAAMVQQVLTFARGVEGVRVPIDVTRVAKDVEKIARDTFPKGISIRRTVAPRLWSINGDATQVHQILMNLCVNARDAMPEGGTLTLAVTNVVIDEVFARMNPEAHRGPYVSIMVTDTGVGIPAPVQQRLFEPFFTTKEVGRGTGLGLSTVHSIVRSHRGFIELYSEPGKGARFTVYLPASPDRRSTGEDTATPVNLPRGHGELVLVVDDEEAIRTIVQRTLERFGYQVLLATNGVEGVAAYLAHGDSIAVVLTDMAMPVMDGPSMIVAIRVVDPKARIIASSGLTSGGTVSSALAAGVTEFVSKPYTAETLLTSIHKVLQGFTLGAHLPIDPGTPLH